MMKEMEEEEPADESLGVRMYEGTVGYLLILTVGLIAGLMVLASLFTKKKRPKNPD